MLLSLCRWTFVVSQVPIWVAPNLITMVGLAVNIGTALILCFFCPTLTEPVSAAAAAPAVLIPQLEFPVATRPDKFWLTA